MHAAHAPTLNSWMQAGGFAEAVVRLALAGAGPIPASGPPGLWLDGPVWRDDPRLDAIPRTERRALVAEQASIVRLNHAEAIDTLTVLLCNASDHQRALILARRMACDGQPLDPGVEARVRRVLDLPGDTRACALRRSTPAAAAHHSAGVPPMEAGAGH